MSVVSSTSVWVLYVVGGSNTVTYTESGTPMLIFQLKWLKFGLQAHLFKMFGHAKLQLSIFCTLIVMKHLVEITKYTAKTFITLIVQEIES